MLLSRVDAPFHALSSGAQGSLFARSATLALCGLLDDSHPVLTGVR